MATIKAEVKNGFPEDQGKKTEAQVQSLVDGYGDAINKLIEAKEKDIMTV